MPDPVVRNSPVLYSVPLHFMQEYVCFATGDLLIPEVVRTVAERQDRYQVQCSRDLQQLDDLLSLSVSITKRYRQRGRDEVESQLGYDEAIPCVPGTGIYHTICS